MKEIDIYNHYKPFRNYLKKFHLHGSLHIIWRYHQEFYQNKFRPIEPTCLMEPGIIRQNYGPFYIWELEIITKELILHSEQNGIRSLEKLNEFINVINFIRRIDGEIAKQQGSNNAFRNLQAKIHQQFPWQIPSSIQSIMRYYLIYGGSKVSSIVENKIGLTLKQVYTLGMAISGHFLNNWGMSINQDYSKLGVDNERGALFFKHITSTFDSLKKTIRQTQKYNATWGYTFNPLQNTPLITFNHDYPNRVICPLPSYLIKRITEGIFYDVVGEPGFDNAYGEAYEEYVGKVLNRAFSSSNFTIIPESQYRVCKDTKHGVDWILKDSTGAICIECKTKRLLRDAKFDTNSGFLDNELENMAKFIVQNYKNVEDIRTKKTNWQYDGCPIYPVVITLEDWLLLNPVILKELEKKVCLLLDKEGIDKKIIKEMPYSVISITDAEFRFQIINQIGISPYAQKNIDKGLFPLAMNHDEHHKDVRFKSLFETEFNEFVELITTSQI